MSRPIINELGKTYGKLTVIGFHELRKSGSKGAFWWCKCECGPVVSVNGSKLRNKEKTWCNGCSKQNFKEFSSHYTGKTLKGQVYKFSKCDFERISKYNWHFRHQYPHSATVGAMHRFILNAKDGQVIDHINGDTTDNRRENLRFASKLLNATNKTKAKGYYKKDGKFRVIVKHKKERYFDKYFENEEEARKTYLKVKSDLIDKIMQDKCK